MKTPADYRWAAAGFAVCALSLAGCATHRSRDLPKFEKPLAKTEFQTVRATAYTHTESDHRKHGRSTALGTTLQAGPVRTAAADWSRWPAGTVFRICPDGPWYVVEDYGWALAGTNTIDLYAPTREEMNRWGVRRVPIQVVKWGDLDTSYNVLLPRAKYAHVKRMLRQIKAQM